MRKVLAMFALLLSGFWAASALAAPSPTLDLAAWVRGNTDLAVSQIAIAGPENVYSLEPLGPRLPTGEVLALVRTEATTADWRAAHQFQSWDAHMLIDCHGDRVRLLRSTSYAERDRGGVAKPDERGDAWFSPGPDTPAATLVAAACDPTFSWPLRQTSAAIPEAAPPKAAPDVLSVIPLKTANRSLPALRPSATALAQKIVRIAPSATAAPTVTVAVFAPKAVTPGEVQQVKIAAVMSSKHGAIAAAGPPRPRLQKARFMSGSSGTQMPTVSEQGPSERPQASVRPTESVVARTFRQLARAGPAWFRRRVEVEWAHLDWETPGRSARAGRGSADRTWA